MFAATPCLDCGERMGWLCAGCQVPDGCGRRQLCSTCTNHAAIVLKSTSSEPTLANAVVYHACRACFRNSSSLDLSKTTEVLDPEGGVLPGTRTMVFVHGGGASRSMFRHHATQLAAGSGGYRCVLMDLPAHGGAMDDVLTTASAVEAVRAAIVAHRVPGNAVVVVGGSLGGYTILEFLGKHPDLVQGAVVACASQCVGVGASLKASMGLRAMRLMASSISATKLVTLLLGVARKSGTLDTHLTLRDTMRPQMFFHAMHQHIDLLQLSDPCAALPKFTGSLLFVDGSKDHRDATHRFLSCCGEGKRPQPDPIVYDDADHFFLHDGRYKDVFVRDVRAFADKL